MPIRVQWWLGLIFFAAINGLEGAVNEDPAREAALQWLQVLDSGNYKDAALMISEQTRGVRDWANYLSTNRGRLGRANKRRFVEVKHRSTIPGAAEVRDYEVLRFKTSFERKPVAFEEVVTAKVGCCWEIFSYEIKEPLSALSFFTPANPRPSEQSLP